MIMMPDTWEYPRYAGWDLAFHCVTLSRIDPDFTKKQLLRMGYEWYQHGNGQYPAYEWNFTAASCRAARGCDSREFRPAADGCAHFPTGENCPGVCLGDG